MWKAAVAAGALVGATALIANEMSKPKHSHNHKQYDATEAPRASAIVFKANWCGACKRFAPDVERYQKQLGPALKVVEIDENRQLADQYKIQSLPTVVYLVNGREVNRKLGGHDVVSELAKL